MSGFISGVLFGKSALRKVLQKHFGSRSAGDIATAAREFPVTSRVDVQTALEQIFAGQSGTTLLGVHSQMGHETPTLAQLFTQGPFQMDLGPLQHDDVDVGEELPSAASRTASGSHAVAVFLSRFFLDRRCAMVSWAASTSRSRCRSERLRRLHARVLPGSRATGRRGENYRGRVLSLENQYNYSGRGGAVNVHRLRKVAREEVVLPPSTLALLEHNVESFVANRTAIKALRFSGEEGDAVLRPAGNRQNPHDSLSGFAVDGSHDAARHGGAICSLWRVLSPRAV